MPAVGQLFRRRGRGYLTDAPDSRDLLFRAEETGNGLQTSVSTERILPLPFQLYQGGTNSCVAHAVAHVIGVLELAELGSANIPSRAWIYYWARWLHGAQKRDAGTYIRLALKALRKWGAPNEEHWAWKPVTRLNRAPGPMAMSHANGRINRWQFKRVVTTGDARLRDLQISIENGHPFVFGTDVDRAFTRTQGPKYIKSIGPDLVGGHAMSCQAFSTPDSLYFGIPQSWKNWRGDGYAWLHESILASPRTRDIWTLERVDA